MAMGRFKGFSAFYANFRAPLERQGSLPINRRRWCTCTGVLRLPVSKTTTTTTTTSVAIWLKFVDNAHPHLLRLGYLTFDICASE